MSKPKISGLETYTTQPGKDAPIRIQQIEPFIHVSFNRFQWNIVRDFEFLASVFKPFFENQRFISEAVM
jgi:hypothetical protein